MTPYVSRYRRIWVIAYSLVQAWSCVEGRVQEIHCLLFLWERLREQPLPGYSGAVLLSILPSAKAWPGLVNPR